MDATGTLNEQNEIYKESWEAASKAVKASVQGIYDSIIDDKWIIKATNNVAEFISGIDQFIDSIGGLKTIIPAIGSIFLMMFANKIPEAISNIGYNIGVLSGKAYKQAAQIYSTTKEQIVSQLELAKSSELYTAQETQQLKTDLAIIKIKERMTINQNELTESEKKMVESTISELDNQNKLIQAIQEKRKLLADDTSARAAERLGGRFFGTQETVESSFEATGLEAKSEAYEEEGKIQTSHTINDFGVNLQDLGARMDSIVSDQIAKMLKLWQDGGYESADEFMQALVDSFNKEKGPAAIQLQTEMSEFFKQTFVSASKGGGRADGAYGWVTEGLQVFVDQFSNLAEDSEVQNALKGLQPDANGVAASSEKIEAAIDLIRKKIQQADKAGEKFGLTFNNITSSPNFILAFKKFRENADKLSESLKTSSEKFDSFVEKAKKGTEHNIKLSETISSATGSIGSLIFGVNNLKGALNSLNNADLTWGEKLSSIFTGLLTGFPMITKSFHELSSTFAHIGGFENFKAEIGTSFFSKEIANNFLSEIKNSKLGNKNQKQISEWLSNAQNINLEAPKRIEAVESIKKAIDDGIKNGQIGKEAGLTLMNNLNAGMEQGVKSSISVIDKLKGVFFSLIAPPTGVILAVTAAIVAIGVAIYAAYKHAQNFDPSYIYEQQKNTLEDYKKAADEASQNLKDFISGFDSYESAIEKTKDLTNGTTEMSDAISEVNKQAQDLIDKYNFLKGRWHYENGAIVFDEGVEEEVEEELRREQEKALAQKSYQRTKTQKAEAEDAFSKLDATLESKRKKEAWFSFFGSIFQSPENNQSIYLENTTQRPEGSAALVDSYLKGGTAIDNKALLQAIQENSNLQKALIEDNIQGFIQEKNDYDKYGFYDLTEYEEYLENNRKTLIEYLDTYKNEIEDTSEKVVSDYKLFLINAYKNSSEVNFSGSEEEQKVKQNAFAILSAARRAENNRNGETLTQKIDKKLAEIENGLYYSKKDFNNVIKEDEYSDSDTLKLLKKKFGENLNAKNITSYYDEIFGEGASDGKDEKELRKRIIQQIIEESFTNKEEKLDEETEQALQKILDNMPSGLAQKLSDAVQTTFEKGGLKSFTWEDYFKNVNFSSLISQKDEIAPEKIISNLLGLTPEQFTELFGKDYADKLKSILVDRIGKYINDSYKKFELENNMSGSEQSYINYAKTRLKKDDEWIKQHRNNIKEAVLLADELNKAAVQGQITLANSLAQTSDNLDELAKSYNDWKKNGTVDLSKLTEDSSLGKVFASLGDEGTKALQELQTDLVNAESSKQIQEAYNKAATAMVDLSIKVGDLSGKHKEEIEVSKKATLEKLKAMGVTNAETLVEEKYAEALMKTTDAQAGYTEAKIKAALESDKTADIENVITAFMNVGIQADVAKKKIVEYGMGLLKAQQGSDSFYSGNIAKQLLNVAKTASVSEGAINALQNAIDSLGNGGSHKRTKEEIRKSLLAANNVVINAGRGAPFASGFYNFNKEFATTYTDKNQLEKKVNELYDAKDNIVSAEDVLKKAMDDAWDEIETYFNKTNITTNYTPPASSSKSSGSKDKKDKKEKTDKEFEKELTRYYKLEKLYEKASNKLDDISKAKDRAYGPKHLKYLDKEIAATQDLIDVNKKYLKEIAAYTQKDLADLNTKAHEMGLNFSIGSLDELPEKYEKMEKLSKEYGERITAEFNAAQAAAVDRYNASAKDTTASEQYDKDLKAAEDNYNAKTKLNDKFLEYLSRVDEDFGKKLEKEREIAELEIEKREKRIEKITYQVEIIGDATEAKEAFLEWQKELSPYQKYRVQFEMNIDRENFRQAISDVEDYSEQLEAILKEAGINATAEDFLNGRISSSDLDKLQDQSIIDAVKETSSNLISSAQKVKETMESITQDYIDGLDRQKDKFQEFADSIDFVREGYTSLLNITELAGGWNKVNKIFDFNSRIKEAKKYLDAETDIRRSALKNQGAELQGYNKMRKQAEIDYNAALASGNAALIEETKKVLDKQTELYRDAYNTWSSGFEDLLNNIFDNFSKKVELMFSVFDKQYNTIKDKFDKTKSLSEDYMDDFQKMYEVNKLNADIQKSINDTKNVKSKQELVALQSKINQKAKEQGKMSEYEVQALRKQYELKLAMQQLEDAQNAKSQVRLTRDAEGNFGYMYTADETDIANAQQNLNDKLYEYYKFNTDRVGELSETYLDLMSQMEEEIKNLSLQNFESEAAYNQAVERIKDFYMQKMDTIKTEMEQALNNNNELTREYAEAIFSLGVNFQMIIDEFKDTNLAQALGMEDSQLAFDKFNETFFGEDGLINKVKNEAAEAFRALGESINEAATSIGGEGGLTDALKELNDEFGETAAGSLSEWAETLIETLGENSKLYKELMKTLPSLSNGLNNVNDSVTKLTGGATNAQTGAAGQGTTDYSGVGKDFLNNPRLVKWEALRAAAAKLWGYDAFGTINWVRDILRVAVGLDPDPGEPKRTLMDLDANGRIDINDARFGSRVSVKLDDVEKDYPKFLNNVWDKLIEGGAKFDTGGYTGAWGKSGRMAMLHEKELVLNSQDTSNLLSSVDILRGISKTLDLQAVSARMASSGLLSSVGINTRTPQAIQQDVHISATFPNVSDSREIEEALNNLVNEAVQYTTQQF